MLQDPAVEKLKPHAVVKVTQVRQLMAQRIDQARVLEQAPRSRVMQPDPDGAVRVAHAVASLHLRTLSLYRTKLETEMGSQQTCVPSEAFKHGSSLFALRLRQAG